MNSSGEDRSRTKGHSTHEDIFPLNSSLLLAAFKFFAEDVLHHFKDPGNFYFLFLKKNHQFLVGLQALTELPAIAATGLPFELKAFLLGA